jgi:hypothetical protein
MSVGDEPSADFEAVLWVHQSLRSPPKRSGTSSSAVRSHVQTGRRVRRAVDNNIQISASTSKILQEGWKKQSQEQDTVVPDQDARQDEEDSDALEEVEHLEAGNANDRLVDSSPINTINQIVGVELVDPLPQTTPIGTYPSPRPNISRRGRKSWTPPQARIKPLAFKGNSDPFNVFPITITSGVNNVFTFIRDVWFPAWIPDAEPSIRQTLSNIEWNGMTECLTSESSAYALLSMYASLLARKSSDPIVFRYSLHCKHQSLTSLRIRLGALQSSTKISQSMLAGITFLLGAAICTENMHEADMHVRALKQVFNRKPGMRLSSTENAVFLRALRFDIRLAFVRFLPTIFDFEKRVPYLLRKTFVRGDRYFDSAPKVLFRRGLDPYLSEPLKTLVLRSRQGFWIWRQVGLDMETGEMVTLTYWVMGQNFIIQGRLLNFFLETRAKPLSSDSVKVTYMRVELCLALGVLCIHNSATNFEVSTQDSTPILLQNLQKLLVQIEDTKVAILDEDFKTRTAILWCLFIGTLSARRYPSTTLSTWFPERFALRLRRISLKTWQEVRDQLELFWYSDEMTPFLSSWFGAHAVKP